MKLRGIALAGVAVALCLRCASAPPPGVVPVVEFPAKTATQPFVAVFVTGDGGWRKIDERVSRVLRHEDIPVVGILSNRYFARARTPEEMTADIDATIRKYASKWNRSRVVLIGFSRGADALPIVMNRLPPSTREMVALTVLMGPGVKAALGLDEPDKYPLEPELQGIRNLPLLCVYGKLERESLCRSLGPNDGRIIELPGGHHFGGGYEHIGRTILDVLRSGVK